MKKSKPTPLPMPVQHYSVKTDGTHLRNRTKGRGRPRKPPKDAPIYPTIPFLDLADNQISNDAELAQWIRDYVVDRPHLNDTTGDLTKWLSAAADALDASNASHLAFYFFNAMRMQYIVAMQEKIDVPGVKADTRLRQLAQVGVTKLKSDKRRGRRVQW